MANKDECRRYQYLSISNTPERFVKSINSLISSIYILSILITHLCQWQVLQYT